ncbi:MAG TPA: TIR domain-containing protein [Candidatus Kapabacteria bacterium]
MADIFISYSSKDRDKAEQLIELLASAGLSVWIDKSGIDVATSWSKEIVQAIDSCKALVVLLSPHSVVSVNVAKEVSLAAEQKKKILPLDLEPVELTDDLRYHLAGLQRAPMTNIDAIIRAIGKIGLEATQAPTLKLVKETDSRKSLMILPFEDLSPTGDNGWFTDGIVSELIQALSNVKSLRLMDAQTTKDFKRYQGTLPVYAREMNIRYFVQGDVRKFGDNIKINSRLLDIETGDHLWQDSLKGTMDDIFDIQEKVAEKIVEGLKIHLGSDEMKKLTERGTENAEAYELYLKGKEYFARQTKEGIELSVQLYSEAIALDPRYAQAYSSKANSLAALYLIYTRDAGLLDEGLSLIREALRKKPDLWSANQPLSLILTLQGKLDEAESAARDYIRNAPDDYSSHFALGLFYQNIGHSPKSIASYEESLKRNPDNIGTLFNLVVSCSDAKEASKQKEYALIALPKFEKHLKLFPDDEGKRVWHTVLLHFADREEEARAAARKLGDLKDGVSLFNVATLQRVLKDYEAGLVTLAKAIDVGYRNIQLLKAFLEDEDLGTLKGTPEWEKVRLMVERVEAEAENGAVKTVKV